LKTSLPTTNMHAFDANNELQKFDSPEGIADAFFPVRLSLYHDRKQVLESEMGYAARTMQNKARFIEAVKDGKIDIISGRKSKIDMAYELANLGFETKSDLNAIRNDNKEYAQSVVEADMSDEDLSSSKDPDYDYLLTMPLSSLTSEKINELLHEASRKEKELKEIKRTQAEDLWRKDLDNLESVLSSLER